MGSGKRRRVKVGCQILLKHNGLNMEKYFLLFLMLNIILESFVQGAPMSEISFPNSTSLDNEYSNLTVTPETPTPALCRDPEDSSSFLCSLYGLVGNVFSVGRAVGSVSKVAEKIISGEPNADFWTYGDSIHHEIDVAQRHTDSAVGEVANSLQDFVPEVREIVNAVVDQAPEAVDYVEKKYDSIVKKYSKGAVGKYDSPVPSDVWWYSWLPPKFIVDRNIRIANTIINGDGWAPPIKETINERLDFVEDQLDGLSS